jgi:uncharacterized protein YcbX
MRVSELWVYPMKSARGIRVEAAELEPRGFVGDRRWMAVDGNGRFVTQRELSGLARLVAAPVTGGLRLALDREEIEVAFPPATAPRAPVSIWKDTLLLPEAPEAAAWLTERLGQPLRLFHQPGDALRPVDLDWGGAGDQVSLADGYPVLIATTATLAAVQREAGASIGMSRFRPNLVVDGVEEEADDGWATIRVGDIELDLVKPCPRCTVTTVDQETGKVAGEEPLAALRLFRMSNDRRVPGVLFGWNSIPRRCGTVRVGDAVEVAESRPAWPIRYKGASSSA